MSTGKKQNVSVTEMASMCGLSRSRFYDLIGTAFPKPMHDEATGRPYYDQNLQDKCLEVRATNVGVDGKPVVFYASRSRRKIQQNDPQSSEPTTNCSTGIAKLVNAMREMGLRGVTAKQVGELAGKLYPNGYELADGETLRRMFLELRDEQRRQQAG